MKGHAVFQPTGEYVPEEFKEHGQHLHLDGYAMQHKDTVVLTFLCT